jgi:hypothetical protein
MYRIESLLSARLFLRPQLVGKRIYFLSNLSGHISLYAMSYGGSVPEPLLPPHIALQNPHLMDGESFYVFPELDKILVMIDRDGDENYQPMVISTSGGFPEPACGNTFDGMRVHCGDCDPETNMFYAVAESRSEQMMSAYQVNLETGQVTKMGESPWGSFVNGVKPSHDQTILVDRYTMGDVVLTCGKGPGERKRLRRPTGRAQPGQEIPIAAIMLPTSLKRASLPAQQRLQFGLFRFVIHRMSPVHDRWCAGRWRNGTLSTGRQIYAQI